MVAIIADVFLLLSVSMSKDTPALVVNNYRYSPTYNMVNEAVAAPPVAPEHRVRRSHKLPRKQQSKSIVKPLLRPSCP